MSPLCEDCAICAKHVRLETLPGGALIADEHVVVSHLEGDDVYLGYLFVEPRRHVRELGDLDGAEAAAFGRAAARAGAALRDGGGAEHVYAAVIGHAAEHLHLHLIARHPGTPEEFWWVRVDEWPEAPRGGVGDVAELMERLREAL